MNNTKHNLFSLIVFMLLFLLGGIIHVAAWGVDGLNNVTELYYCAFCLFWSVSVQKRITDTHTRNLLLRCAGIIIAAYLFQTCRYLLMSGLLTANRYLLYCDYVFIAFLATSFVEIGLRLLNPDISRRSLRLIYIPAIVMSLLFLTNDLHMLMIYFPEGLEHAKTVFSYRAGFYLFYVWVGISYVYFFYLLFKYCRVASVKKLMWICFIPPVLGGILLVLHVFSLPKLNGHLLWNIEDYIFLAHIGLAHFCIELGLIPSNTDYNRLFRLAKNRAVITNRENKVLYSSSDDLSIPVSTEDCIVDSGEIHGGRIIWTVDVSSINKLNRQLQEATEEINLRNDYLRHQNELKEEKSLLDARNSLYDRISTIVRPQLDKINLLTDSLAASGNGNPENPNIISDDTKLTLAHIAVLNAYIKRRSNMELLSEDAGTLSLKELFTALSESCEYLKLSGATAIVSPVSDKTLKAVTVITAYDFFEAVIETDFGCIGSIMIRLSLSDNRLVIRILTDTAVSDDPAAALAPRFSELKAQYSFEKEDNETSFFLAIPEGGDQV